MLYKSSLLTLETIGYSLDIYSDEYCLWAQVAVLDVYIAYIGLFGTGYAGIVFG